MVERSPATHNIFVEVAPGQVNSRILRRLLGALTTGFPIPATVNPSLNRLASLLFGDPRRNSLEHRLFNTISLLNAIANFGGAITLLFFRHDLALCLLHLATGVAFLGFYLVSRLRGVYRAFYWPFVLLIVVFLFFNALEDAGSLGGAHYYLIPALVIATILSRGARRTALAVALFVLATLALFYVEVAHPEWIRPHASARERLMDVSAHFIFVQIFTGLLVMVLSQNLNQERQKSDRLLLNILPESIAHELKMNDRVRPLNYDDATVLFTDFVGFTRLAENMTPERLIAELDECFRHFDIIARKHNVEKIKTIGDAYMAVGGIPIVNRTHAIDCVLVGLEIQQFMAELQERRAAQNRPHWHLRVGIHSGRLVAGVIGQEKFAYDVWGDTVNTASRLESSGVADRINISGATYERVKEFFACEYRGRVAAKNKGEIDMYFVNGIRPELSHNGEGRFPNEQFFELYRQRACGVSRLNVTVTGEMASPTKLRPE
ncbi:MAG TPA: adenylate/guanylate cyclase domain-containing protein [Blastocatellia bacterium]|nr:adenylate/guanylate cyclase domain-containing protein [Blastocatellia bacterium]